MLHPQFKYVDGMTVIELQHHITDNTYGTEWVFENDLTKQDRQTDDHIIKVEMAIYKLLGVNDAIIDWWYTVH